MVRRQLGRRTRILPGLFWLGRVTTATAGRIQALRGNAQNNVLGRGCCTVMLALSACALLSCTTVSAADSDPRSWRPQPLALRASIPMEPPSNFSTPTVADCVFFGVRLDERELARARADERRHRQEQQLSRMQQLQQPQQQRITIRIRRNTPPPTDAAIIIIVVWSIPEAAATQPEQG